ncbi:HTH-type transcriptional repressor [Pandoraea terrae]|uniref:HTH-type transcriptional repressor n=1 Tax=Pandoraea terrae TaxID=1537710 RepID=A0A5E4S2Y0_9BURK|nr:TetR/AcrR family transcriptional regulator [Pandoraea terrae]VVD69553.1 HTH-type transcriptional repressor [Pandoraea terrae]
MSTSASVAPPEAVATKPVGAREVREAILDAAVRLMTERNRTDVALREIAREANVNHGLVHRHFGTRHDVLIAVLRRQSAQGADFLRDAKDIHAAIDGLWSHPAMAPNAKLMASALLDGVEPGAIAVGQSFRRLNELLGSDDSPGADKRIATTVAITCMIMGWGIFGDFLTAAAGVTESDRLREDVLAILHAMGRDATA